MIIWNTPRGIPARSFTLFYPGNEQANRGGGVNERAALTTARCCTCARSNNNLALHDIQPHPDQQQEIRVPEPATTRCCQTSVPPMLLLPSKPTPILFFPQSHFNLPPSKRTSIPPMLLLPSKPTPILFSPIPLQSSSLQTLFNPSSASPS